MSLVDAVLRARGIEGAGRLEFLRPAYEALRHDPFLLPDMDKAVERLVRAHEKQEKVVIYGDYDIDGLTATTLLLDAFTSFGIEVRAFIPNRFVEGYGLAVSAVEQIAEQGADLIVTVDCGSLSHKEITRANELGVDVIVTDHHSVATTMPPAVAVINPKRLAEDFPGSYDNYSLRSTLSSEDTTSSIHDSDSTKSLQPAGLAVLKQSSAGQDFVDSSSGLVGAPSDDTGSLYPFLDLAGVGVAFKLVQALQTKLDGLPLGHEKWLLDLVALGTVCDVVQLRDENRANVLWGLRVMKKTRRPGLKLLMAVSRVDPEKLNARSLGFALGPRLNAAGRLETAQLALDLLTTDDNARALELAELLDTMNRERRAEQDRIVISAKSQVEERYKNDKVLVVSHASWSHGIIGIVAAKLLETYCKPTFVLQEMPDGTAKGSARSFGDFSAVEAIRATEKFLIKGGGHKLAAGVTLQTEHIGPWRAAVNEFYLQQKLTDQKKHLQPRSDATLTDLRLCTEAAVEELATLEPFGNGNPSPVFEVHGLHVVSRRTMGTENQHVRYRLRDAHGQTIDMVAFNKADEFTVFDGEEVTVWCELDINEWNGRRSVQGRLLKVELVSL